MPPLRKTKSPQAATSAGVPAEPEPRFINRDVSWLEFNRRVLAQAGDDRVPILERLKFLAIYTSNLDEFFMKRVGLLKRQVHAGITAVGPDGMTPRQQLQAVRELVQELDVEQTRVYQKQILPLLAQNDIHIVRYDALLPEEKNWADSWYRANVFSALTPLAVNPTHRFPFVSNLSDNVAVVATRAASGGEEPAREYARLKIPPTIRRFIPLPRLNGSKSIRFILLLDVIRNNLGDLFPGMKILEHVYFRVTRSAGIQKDDFETLNLLQSIEEDLKQRKFARAVRLEIEPDPSPTLLRWLLDKLRMDQKDVYEQPAEAEYSALLEIVDVDRADLKTTPWKPVVPPRLASEPSLDRAPGNIFATIRRGDILLHHPYESFNASVERFIAAAAADPEVVTIKQTLYRTSPDSPFIESLIRAAESGKQVACLVELRARFDESRNVRFARQLEKAGVHVAYGVRGLKTHCKTSLVVRREKHGLRCYAHLGTGNYNPKTALLYTDLGLLTCDPEITADLVNVFNYLTGLAAGQEFQTLLVAPFNMRDRFYALIAREMENAKRGRPARIVAKINSMEDREVAERLYAASQAGVSITLIVRGFCCIRPGVAGLSENIRVVSVIGRFLEHSRIFHFAAGQDDPNDGDWFIGSADWMYRNLSNRVEVTTPVSDKESRQRLTRTIEVMLADRRNAWDMRPDGTYARREIGEGVDPNGVESLGTFETLMRDAAYG
ncbi:MAG: polyphosphate kinase 1 [Phycisphaerales bacterium]|nr:MAG: polyphosphate kinase 1 [Phycisphaerales bacterium]